MALFNITVNAQVNQAPSQIGDLTLNLDYNELHVFTAANFTTGTTPPYADPEGDAAEKVKIITIPTQGVLALNAVPVIANDEISMTSIATGFLTYQADPADLDGYTNSQLTFDISDYGSALYSGLTGTVTFIVAADVNDPPSAVGDNTLNTDHAVTVVFTTADFTTNTTPAYADPEGDPAFKLRVDSLPIEGTLKLNGVNVTLNQEITFVDINSGLFTYVPNSLNSNSYNVDFNFSIQDSGSGQYTT